MQLGPEVAPGERLGPALRAWDTRWGLPRAQRKGCKRCRRDRENRQHRDGALDALRRRCRPAPTPTCPTLGGPGHTVCWFGGRSGARLNQARQELAVKRRLCAVGGGLHGPPAGLPSGAGAARASTPEPGRRKGSGSVIGSSRARENNAAGRLGLWIWPQEDALVGGIAPVPKRMPSGGSRTRGSRRGVRSVGGPQSTRGKTASNGPLVRMAVQGFGAC